MAQKKIKKTFQTPLGIHDILPQEQLTWQYVSRISEDTALFYNFEKIDTPILEYSELFEKGTGKNTDIVQKEMFSLKTRGGDQLTLRPEGTPSIARAYIQHGMHKWTSPVKLYYMGPMFRHEKPQRGRFRQFYQFGLETLGEADPIRDAEIIQIFFVILTRLRIKSVYTEVNSIGCSSCRPKFVKSLKDYYRYRIKNVCVNCRKRYKENPLRLLDCDDEKCIRSRTDAPQVVDYLCVECNAHFKKVLDFLDASNIPYLLNPHLVRGLDYYTRTVFEIFEGEVDEVLQGENRESHEKRLALASGGRYDQLVKFIGGPNTPAVGGSMGVERVLEILRKEAKEPRSPVTAPVFLVQLGEIAKKKGLTLLEEFRKADIRVREAFGRDSISAQLKLAHKYQVRIAVILGQKEVLDKVAILREMDTGSQETIPEEKLINEIKKRLK